MTQPILLDGAMGQEIVSRGGGQGYGEWAVAALYDNPRLVKAIHTDYIQAGADVITTNNYSTTRTRLQYAGMVDQFETLVHTAGRLAVASRQEAATPDVRIAASLPPLENSYRTADFQLTFETMVTQYRELINLLDPYVDLYLAETLSTTLEARAVLTAAANRDKPVWLAWTLEDHGSSNLRSGEPLADALPTLAPFDVDAVLVNCCTPNSVTAALSSLRASDYTFGAFANGFAEIPDDWNAQDGVAQLETRDDLSPTRYADHAQQWLSAGASIVGGCCEVGPAHIAQLRRVLDRKKSTL